MRNEGSCLGTDVSKLCGVGVVSSACGLPFQSTVPVVALSFPFDFLSEASGGTTYHLNANRKDERMLETLQVETYNGDFFTGCSFHLPPFP